MSGSTGSKTPAELKDFTLDWTKDLGIDSIATSSWSISPYGVTTSSPSISGLLTTVWLAGGVAEQQYLLTNTILTNAGRDLQKTLIIQVVPVNYLP